jgi:hypothetical protein
VEYPRVPHSHVVPAGYLRAWEREGRIVLRRPGSSVERLVSVRDAGVRTNFYRRQRPGTGETVYDIEWTLGQLESAAMPVVSRLPDCWPLAREEKGKVGQFVGVQFARGPAYKGWFESQLDGPIADLHADPERYAVAAPGRSAQEAVAQAESALRSDSFRNGRMLKASRIASTILCSMHWTLVEFRKARLATSDHPVVVWPLERAAIAAEANDLAAGLINSLEVIIPVGPRHLLLMSWAYEEDACERVIGRGRHASTTNAFVVANADAQWFHAPGDTPWLAKGPRRPLSEDLISGYDRAIAKGSLLRAKAEALARQEAEAPLSNDPLSIVTVRSGT